jgi:hypothetical protein
VVGVVRVCREGLFSGVGGLSGLVVASGRSVGEGHPCARCLLVGCLLYFVCPLLVAGVYWWWLLFGRWD